MWDGGFIKNWEGMGGEGPNTSLVYIYIKKTILGIPWPTTKTPTYFLVYNKNTIY